MKSFEPHGDFENPLRRVFYGPWISAGCAVEACKVEINAMHDHLDVLHGALCTYQASIQSMAQRRFGYRLRQVS